MYLASNLSLYNSKCILINLLSSLHLLPLIIMLICNCYYYHFVCIKYNLGWTIQFREHRMVTPEHLRHELSLPSLPSFFPIFSTFSPSLFFLHLFKCGHICILSFIFTTGLRFNYLHTYTHVHTISLFVVAVFYKVTL